MNKKKYIKPAVEVIGLITEDDFMQYSYDNTGNGGSDGESGYVIEGDLEGNEEVG